MYKRPQIYILNKRLDEAPEWMIVVAGPRQIGKSTMVRQALEGRSSTFIATDQPLPDPFNITNTVTTATSFEPASAPTAEWIVRQWTQARAQANTLPAGQRHILAIDEIQKIPRWSEVVKGLWDADRAANTPLHIVLLGSSPWLMQKGLTESLAGRYETIQMTHWAYEEMQSAFDFSLDEYMYFGAYPGAAKLIRDENRWKNYVLNALIKPNIENDILQMTRVDKPALLKALFELGCGAYSGQLVAQSKIQGTLQDAGNTTTLSHYLELLSTAGLLTGLQKYAGQAHRQRASAPKFNVHNTALMSAQLHYTFAQAQADHSHWGRLVESAVGSHLINNKPESALLFYWRESPHEVDFVVQYAGKLLAIEVKSGSDYATPKGLSVFAKQFPNVKPIIVGQGGIGIAEFLLTPLHTWFEQ